MITLEVADLVIIVSHTLHLDTDRVLDLLDPTAAEAALAQARSGADDDEPASQAAWLLHALVRQRPLRRGNQQVALVAMLQLLALIGRGQTMPSGHIPFTPRAKKVLELSLREALQLGHSYIGTEHILLGLIREGEGVAAQVLARLGADHARVRERVLELLTGECEEPGAETRLVRLTVPADLVDTAEQLAEVRRQKEAAIDAGDLDSATALRDQEKQLLADKLRLEREWTGGVDVQAVIEENQRVHRELERLRELLRQHGIEPNGGTARTA